ncbi:hypothetical protein AGR3A_Lc180118 [Agrobacterium tomkonis CFBP 6623]|uniref:Uncharacterized protein n=1 Tax=Agrobacterium tomkonis CFBP 6623 TaxID=1183432 RepID=A0A1S7S2A4_9HYPH|nr:hypothetical protein AGR3A_Lc180118 [Agrobacterium tomkonis CFBP 6623]
MAVVVVLVLLVVGSIAFHLLSPWWWTPIASNWSYIDNTITITRAGSGNLNSGDKWNFCLTSA